MAKIGQGIQIALSWVPGKNGSISPGAISVENDIYVARRKYEDEWIPGKLVTGYQTCYCPLDGRELESSEYEVLCDTCLPNSKKCYAWEKASGGEVPKKAIVAGISNGKPLYIAKGPVYEEMCVGKVQEGQEFACLPWGGEEHRVKDYEVLVFKKK
ncbi:unnamed protein product [Heterobilharzia americana]|nr:unnamed protein product [Heterobilharzia americana]CAH8442858.1 unnamed protein product [Heterobilharzia americana]